jgi:hypothetical protein
VIGYFGSNGEDHEKSRKTCLGGQSRPAGGAQIRRQTQKVQIAQAKTG